MPFPIVAGVGAGLSALGSLFGGGGQRPPSLAEIEALMSSGKLSTDYKDLFAQMVGSPYGRYMLSQANLQGAQAGQGLRRTAALAGGTNVSPFAALAGTAASATQGYARQQAMGSMSANAFDAAMKRRQMVLQAFMAARGMEAPPNPFGQMFAGLGTSLGQYALYNQMGKPLAPKDTTSYAPPGGDYYGPGYTPPPIPGKTGPGVGQF